MARPRRPYDPTDPDGGPVIHAASQPGADWRVHMGAARCGAGVAHRTEGEQYVSGAAVYVTCRSCQRLAGRTAHGRGRLAAAEDDL